MKVVFTRFQISLLNFPKPINIVWNSWEMRAVPMALASSTLYLYTQEVETTDESRISALFVVHMLLTALAQIGPLLACVGVVSISAS